MFQFGPIRFNVIQYDQKVVQCGPKVQFGLVFSHYDPICSKSGPVFPIMIQKSILVQSEEMDYHFAQFKIYF